MNNLFRNKKKRLTNQSYMLVVGAKAGLGDTQSTNGLQISSNLTLIRGVSERVRGTVRGSSHLGTSHALLG